MVLNVKVILAITIAGQLTVHGLAPKLFKDTTEYKKEGLLDTENDKEKISTLGLYKEIIGLRETAQKARKCNENNAGNHTQTGGNNGRTGKKTW